jgi:hypothetical protein
MKKNRSTLLLGGLVVIVAVGLPFHLSRQRAATLDVATKQLKTEETGFHEKVTTGAKVRKNAAEWTRTREILAAAMPPDADIQGAIRSMQALTESDGGSVKWLQATASNLQVAKAATPTATTSPAKPAADSETKTTLAPKEATSLQTGGFDLTISVSGTRNKVLAFVTKLEQKPDQQHRVFVVKNMNLTPDASAPGVAVVAGAPSATSLSDGNAPVKATISLKVTTFGTPAAKTNDDPVAVVAAGPQPSVSSVPVVTPAAGVGS